jgi:hypothetical protein
VTSAGCWMRPPGRQTWPELESGEVFCMCGDLRRNSMAMVHKGSFMFKRKLH